MEECINLIDDSDDDKDEQTSEFNYHIELLKEKKQFLNLEVEIEKRASDIDEKMYCFRT